MSVILRLAALVGSAAAAAAMAARWALELPPAREATFGMLVTELAAWTVVGCCLWALALLLAAATEAVTCGRVAATQAVPCPDRLRRAVLVAVGAAVVCTLASPADADEVGSAPSASYGLPRTAPPAQLPVPARPEGVLRAGAGARLPRAHRAVVVREGDSLWDLVATRMPGADDRWVAGAVAATYRANRRVIGPDPDLIRPGQRLVLPVPLQSDPDRQP